eukprot:COSAG06_NODE_60476_length_270_cov_3.631579_1_plen_23_part_01
MVVLKKGAPRPSALPPPLLLLLL